MSVVLDDGKLHRCDPDAIVIGLINNMPDTALEATEHQFADLLDAAGCQNQVRLRLFALPEILRGASGRHRLQNLYSDIGELWARPIDGLIVTGAEPYAADLKNEPYWPSMIRVLQWAERHALSSVWSCLAAHAAVLHLAGIQRKRLPEKCSGIFTCTKLAYHPLTADLPQQFSLPHSRYNGLNEDELVAAGFQMLTRSPDIGADMFVKEGRCCFLFIQGHPEYQEYSLLREHRRDIGRFLRGEMEKYPAIPKGYFDTDTTARFLQFRELAMTGQSGRTFVQLSDAIPEPILTNTWRPHAVQLYRNWLSLIVARKRMRKAEEGSAPSPIRVSQKAGPY